MSTQNIIDSNNLPTADLMNKSVGDASIDVVKKLKYGVGEVCHTRLRHLLRLQRLHCSSLCYITEDNERQIREDLITASIRSLDEL